MVVMTVIFMVVFMAVMIMMIVVVMTSIRPGGRCRSTGFGGVRQCRP